MDKRLETRSPLENRRAAAQDGAEFLAARHEKGAYSARERLVKLFDAGGFVELDALVPGGGVRTGYGTVGGRAAYCFAQDIGASGGAMSAAQAKKIDKLLDMAQLTGAPVVMLLDSEGIAIADGASALAGYARTLGKLARLSGVCPLIACVMGPCIGCAALYTQVADIVLAVKSEATLSLHAKSVVAAVAGKLPEELKDGVEKMAEYGAIDVVYDTEDAALSAIAALLDILPACNAEDAPMLETDDLNLLVGDAPDTLALAAQIADGGALIELGAMCGKAVHTCLARLGGRSAGIIALDSRQDGGRLDENACRKVARFVRFFDCYHLPVVTLADSEGLAVPAFDAQPGLMRAAAQMLYAYAETTAPKLAVVAGRAVGQAFVALGGKAMADVCYALPDAVIAPISPEVAAQTLYIDRLQAGEERAALESEYALENGAQSAAELGLVDDVIEPAQTRKHLLAALEMLVSKRDVNLPKKHGNTPL